MSGKLKFIFFSILGFVLFLVPLPLGGESKIFISHFVDFVTNKLLFIFLPFTQFVALIVLIGTIVFLLYDSKNEYLNKLFKTDFINTIIRIVGSFLYIMVMNNWLNNTSIGQIINNPNTGGLMAGDGGLLTTLYITFFIGILILPLLTHFGAVEFIGTILSPVIKKVFRVPGYAAVDGIASFVGDGTIGIVVTDTQYKRGYYTKREAYIIATSFSIVGIAFAASIAEELGFSSIFPIFYGSIALATIIVAIITARLPLKKFEDEYKKGVEPFKAETDSSISIYKNAIDLASKQAEKANFSDIMKESVGSIINIYIGFLPVIMFVGTVALIVAENTSLFTIISLPLVPVYSLLGFSNEVAQMMASASIVGFADMYLPALFITESPSEASKFFIGVMSFTQLIFMSETGMVLLKSSIGLNFLDIIKVFIYRTIVCIPIIMIITYLLVQIGVISA